MNSRSISVFATGLLVMMALTAACLAADQATAPKQIHLSAQIFQVPAKLAGQLNVKPQADAKVGSQISSETAAKLVASLRASKEATLLASPIISTLDNRSAVINISTQSKADSQGPGTSLTVKPHILADGKISLRVKLSVTTASAGKNTTAKMSAHIKAADGETVIVTGELSGSKDVLVLAVTPKVIK